MARLLFNPRFRAFDANGEPLAGGKLYTYETGTTTPRATYSDADGLTPNANPVILDANGEATIFTGSVQYKLILKNSSDVTQWTIDPYNGNLSSAIDGVDGRTINYGSGAPGGGTGNDGDFYLNTANYDFYGPKASGSWPAAVSLTGQATAAQAAQAAAEAAQAAAEAAQTAAETAATNAQTAETNAETAETNAETAETNAEAAQAAAEDARDAALAAQTAAETAETNAETAETNAETAATNAAASAAAAATFDPALYLPKAGATLSSAPVLTASNANQNILTLDPQTGTNVDFRFESSVFRIDRGAASIAVYDSGNLNLNGTASPKWSVQHNSAATQTTLTSYFTRDQGYPVIAVKNSSSTANNASGIAFASNGNDSTEATSGILGVHEAHTAGAESGWLGFWVRNAGTIARAIKIAKDKILTFDGYTTAGVLTNDSSGVIASVSPGASGNVLTSNGSAWTSAAPAGGSLARSEVVVDTGNGHGSSANCVRRFSNERVNTGTNITYADSSTNGASFTVNANGYYAISYSDKKASAQIAIGITVNEVLGTTGATSINGISYAQGFRSIMDTGGAGYIGFVGWVGYLASGDVVRAHTTGGADGSDNRTVFSIVQIGAAP